EREVEQQRNEAQTQRNQAAKNLQLASQAVEQYTTRVSSSWELKAHGLEQLRKDLLETAIHFRETFVRQQSDDPDLQAERAKAYEQLAVLSAETVSQQRAIELCQQARDIFAQLARDYPEVAIYRARLALSYHDLGAFYRASEQTERAVAASRQALT